MKKHYSLIVKILILFCITSAVKADEAEDILALALEKQNYKTLQADVSVETSIEGNTQKMIQEYKYWIKKPDRVKMEITKPSKQTIVMSNGIVHMKRSDGNVIRQQVSELPGMADMNLQRMQTMAGMKEKYVITKIKETGNTAEIKLVPKAKGVLPGMVMKVEKGTGKIIGNSMADIKNNVAIESVNEKVEVIAGTYVPVEIKSVSVTNVGGKEIKMTIRMYYKNVRVNEAINNEEFKAK